MDSYMQELAKMEKSAEKRQQQYQRELQESLFSWEEREAEKDRRHRQEQAEKQRNQDREMQMLMMKTIRDCMMMAQPMAQTPMTSQQPMNPPMNQTSPPRYQYQNQYETPHCPQVPTRQQGQGRRTFINLDSGAVGVAPPPTFHSPM